jgi:hypothetical protein
MIALALSYAVLLMAPASFWFFGLEEPPEAHIPPFGMLVFIAGAYGCYRVWAFHPAIRGDYREWLARTPWTAELPMPLGPLHLVWQDLVYLALPTSLAAVHASALVRLRPAQDQSLAFAVFALLPVASFSLAHWIMVLQGCWSSGVLSLAYLLAVGLGGLVYGLGNPWMTIACGVALYAIEWMGIRRSLAALTADILNGDVNAVATGVDLNSTLGWPFRAVGPREHAETPAALGGLLLAVPAAHASDPWSRWPRFVRCALLSGLVAWWLYVLASWCERAAAAAPSENRQLRGFVPLAFALTVLVAPIFRYGIYCTGYRSPISIWGRLASGRWIQRGYDHVFLAPLAMVLLGPASIWLQSRLGLPRTVAFPVGTALVIWLGLVLPPSLFEWQLTGSHRLYPEGFNPRPPARPIRHRSSALARSEG